MAISDDDLERLRRCVELAREALDDGDEPFGSILVGGDGTTLYEDRNRVKDGDHTRHPEFAIARWAVEANGGRIEVESEAGGGALFRIVLPLAERAGRPGVEADPRTVTVP